MRVTASATARSADTMRVSSAGYLNVDLEISSRSNIGPLIDELSRDLFLVNQRRLGRTHVASFEVPGLQRLPDDAISFFTRALSSLSPLAMKLRRAAGLTFDIGIEEVASHQPFALTLRPETINALARLRARVVFTLYPSAKRLQADSQRTRQRTPRSGRKN